MRAISRESASDISISMKSTREITFAIARESYRRISILGEIPRVGARRALRQRDVRKKMKTQTQEVSQHRPTIEKNAKSELRGDEESDRAREERPPNIYTIVNLSSHETLGDRACRTR